MSSPVVPNTTAYIVDKPSYIYVKSGFAAASPVVKFTQLYYDNLTQLIAPTKGDLFKQVDFRDLAPTYNSASVTYVYDYFGNRLSAANQLNETTSWTYDLIFGLFVTEETNPLGQKTKWTPNFVCGAPADKTGVDSIKFTYTYDVFCRKTQEFNTVNGNYLDTLYSFSGAPTTQYVRTHRPHGGGSTYQYSWFDGFGRAYFERVYGSPAAGSESITYDSDTKYDVRGNVVSKSLPHLPGETPKLLSTSHDWADRPLTITQADGYTKRSFTYQLYLASSGQPNPGLAYDSVTDELNRVTIAWKSTRGDVILTARQFGAGYQYEFAPL